MAVFLLACQNAVGGGEGEERAGCSDLTEFPANMFFFSRLHLSDLAVLFC